MNGIFFPGLNIFLENVPRGFTIFGIFIPLYAVCITLGFILALQVARIEGKRTGCKDDDYLDYFLVMVIPSILGARIYYILFNLDRFTGTGKSVGGILFDMINIRNGGLAIYGGLIVGTAVSASGIGYIYDFTHSYTPVFLLLLGLFILNTLFVLYCYRKPIQ